MTKLYNCVRLLCLTTTLVILGSITSETFAQNYDVLAIKIYDQSTDAEVPGLGALYDDQEIDRNQLPENFYIVVETGADAESVRVKLKGNAMSEEISQENDVPYTFPEVAENNNNWNGGIDEYEIEAKAYENNDCDKEKDKLSLKFKIVSNPIINTVVDSDGDGISDNEDSDDDNDGVSDLDEGCGSTTNIAGTIGIGSVVTNQTYSIEGTEVTYSTSGSNTQDIYGYFAGNHRFAIKLEGDNNESKNLDLSFSNPIAGVSFKLTDFDYDESFLVNIYDENNNIYDLSSTGVVSVGSNVSQTGNRFTENDSTEGDVNGNYSFTDLIGSVAFYIPGSVSRIELQTSWVGGASIRMTELTYCSGDEDGDSIPDFLDDTTECGSIESFQLINSDTNEVIQELADGDIINAQDLPENYHVQVLTEGQVGSFATTINGETAGTNNAPYVYPASGSNWNAGAGTYTLSTSLFLQAYCAGSPCDGDSITFTIEEECTGVITGYQLMNTDTGEVIAQLNDNDRLDVSTLPANYHIEILTEGNVESVATDVNGETRTENFYTWDYPYTGGSWNAGIGAYVISSTAYSKDDGEGEACDEFAICLFIDAPSCDYEESTEDCVYTTSDTEQCNAGGFYQLWISGIGQTETIGTTTFVENTENGTANYTGTFATGNDTITVNVVYSGLTTDAPTGSPKDHFCEDADATDWKYYTEVCGTFDSQLYGLFLITRKGPAFQLGEGANVTSQSGTQLGGSGWFYLTSPSNCPAYTEGDFNFNLSGGCVNTEVCETIEFSNVQADVDAPYDGSVAGAMLEWEDPIASSIDGDVEVVQIAGPPSGSVFPAGSETVITYAAGSEYGCEQTIDIVLRVAAPDPCEELEVTSIGFQVTMKLSSYSSQTVQVEFYDLNGNLVVDQPVTFNARGEATVAPQLGFGYFVVKIVGADNICSKQFHFSPEE